MCAPIIIPTLCRYEHFVRLIESLKRNSYAKYTDVYIGLDFPSSENHLDGYRKISLYLEGEFVEFKSLNVIKRQENYGSGRNLQALTEFVLSKYDRFIKADDDLEFSPNFLEYMNKCLDEYEYDDEIVAISGYSYPLKWKVGDGATIFKENFICPMWGTGFWKKKYMKLEEYIVEGKSLYNNARNIILNGSFIKMSDVCRKEFADLCLSQDSESSLATAISDISVRMYMAVCDKYVITPTLSKARNWGFDGTGQYCQSIMNTDNGSTAKNYLYHLQQMDVAKNFSIIPDTIYDNSSNKKAMGRFDPIPIMDRMNALLKITLFAVFGRRLYSKIIEKFRTLWPH
ncbi:MAG: glycosyltransferase family 2 protein [Bacteroidales bacterium]|nr:glycosyltransferase family 2 protein [Bacteroidales bacterium]